MKGRHYSMDSEPNYLQSDFLPQDDLDIPFWERSIELTYLQVLLTALVAVAIFFWMSWTNDQATVAVERYSAQQEAEVQYQEGYINGYADGHNAYLRGDVK